MSTEAIRVAFQIGPLFIVGIVALLVTRSRRLRKEETARFADLAPSPETDLLISEMRQVGLLIATTRYGFPAFLSFFVPGLGQIVKGQFLTGALVMVSAVLFGALCVVGVGFLMLPLLWIIQLYDAYAKPDAALSRAAERLRARGRISGTSPPAP